MTDITCSKRYREIPFAHRQPLHDGHCKLIHGHNWDIEITFTADWRDENGFVVDFGKLKDIKAFLDTFDHALVLPEYDEEIGSLKSELAKIIVVPDASCEGLARFFFGKFDDIVGRIMPERNCRVQSVTVYEDSANSATYTIKNETKS